jgi:hypothetical protein
MKAYMYFLFHAWWQGEGVKAWFLNLFLWYNSKRKSIINLSHLFANYLLYKIKIWIWAEKIIQPEILVELSAKLVESHYWPKSKKKTFTALRRSTNLSGLKRSFETTFFTTIKFIKMSQALIGLWIFRINQVEDGAKHLSKSFENGLAYELLADILLNKTDKKW